MKHRILSCTLEKNDAITTCLYPGFLRSLEAGLLMALHEYQLMDRMELRVAIDGARSSTARMGRGRL